MKVYEDSIVRFSKRVNFDIGCQMDFRMYPVDMQKCEVQFESFGYQTHVITINFSFSGRISPRVRWCYVQEVVLKWGDDDSGEVNENINLPGYYHHVHMVL